MSRSRAHPTGHPLTSARAKFRRATQHAEAFERARRALFESDAPLTIGRFDRLTREYSAHLAVPAERLTDLSAILGDCVFGLRSALDHAVFDLAIAHSGQDPPPDESKLEFPIFLSEDDFARAGSRRIPALSPTAQQYIASLQPYQADGGGTGNTLWVIHELNRRDKHRRLHPLVGLLGEKITVGETTPRDVPLELFWLTPPGALANDAPLVKFTVPEPHVLEHVDVRVELELVLVDSDDIHPTLPNKPLSKLVPLMVAHVQNVLTGLERSA